jgi:predicted RNA-binding Zn ribbon-like protein
MVQYITQMTGDSDATVQDLRFDAGSLSLNLVATVGRRFGDRIERLSSVDRLETWLRGVGLVVGTPLDDDDLREVRALREHLDLLFRDLMDGEGPPASAVAAVNDAAAGSAPQLTMHATDAALTGAGASALAPVIALIAVDAIRVLTGCERERLRRCEAGDCRMVYLASGRRPRRWCSSQRCGNRMRVAAHRARTADPTPGSASSVHPD